MNFEFIKGIKGFETLYKACNNAEKHVFDDPVSSMFCSRQGLEFCVKFIYESALSKGEMPEKVYEAMEDPDFKAYIGDESVLSEMHYIRKSGNNAVHNYVGNTDDAIQVLETLQFVIGDLFSTLKLIKGYPAFIEPTRENLMQDAASTPAADNRMKLKQDMKENKPVVVDEEVLARYAVAMKNAQFDTSFKRNEDENRKLFIQASIREAGWPIVEKSNVAKPLCAGKDIVIDASDTIDYVFYSRDGKPFAIIEYSETKENPVMGRRKANRVASKLAAKYNVLPIIYYTNGYMINIIDQLGYPTRRVFCFNSYSELELMIQQKDGRKDISSVEINDAITDRDYQKKAISTVCNVFNDMRRGSLIVLATGAGKTRISISIVDVLMRYGWIKNVLFLADRTSLVKQAMKNFKKLLPSVTVSEYSGESLTRDPNARIIFSTYQTMIREVNRDTRTFGTRRFDLIIVDEAHRSIFSKFGMLFNYFDSLLLGLTATPKLDQDKSSYEVFRLPTKTPDYAYELADALNDGYLVGFSVKDRTTDILKRGFKYNDLTQVERFEIENSVKNNNYSERDIKAFKRRFVSTGRGVDITNRATIRIMLDDLVNNSIKLPDGNIGKTIIFAERHEEAQVIVEEFYKNYPRFGPDYCKLIDSTVNERYSLIDKLEDRNSGFQIAVSVDMLETGVDVPDLLNVVFFRRTWSKIKFLQMIGRGTRLSKNLFGEGRDKKGFLIFDYYDNFSFFSMTASWSTTEGSGTAVKSIDIEKDSVSINYYKMSICKYIQSHNATEFEKAYREELLNGLVTQIRELRNDDIEIQYHLPYINKYRVAENWDYLTDEKMEHIRTHILPYIPNEEKNPNIRGFDRLMYAIEEKGVWLAERQPKKGVLTMPNIMVGSVRVSSKLTEIYNELERLSDEMIKPKEADILALKEGNANSILNNFSLENTERIRLSLRDLMPYIKNELSHFVIDIEDNMYESKKSEEVVAKKEEKSYPERAMEYIAHTNDPEIGKLANLEKLTDDEKEKIKKTFTSKLGTPVDFTMWSENKEMLQFLRSKTGISDMAISKNFGNFYNTNVLNEEQYKVVTQMIDYARINGDITFTDLLNGEAFKGINILSLFGKYAKDLKDLINTIHSAIL